MRDAATPAHANNFDGVRLCAALIVIFGHEFSVRGLAQPMFFGSHIASLGVKIFFSVSGYLVAQSFERDPHAWRFLQRRALRILPGLALCVLATVFLIGPLAARGPLAAYFGDALTYAYLWNIGFGFVEDMPGLFAANPLPNAVNGSLWSLPAEAAMYLLLLAAALASAGSARRWSALTLLMFAAAVGALYAFGIFGWPEILIYGTRLSAFCAVASFFCVGSLLWQQRARLPLRLDLAAALALVGWGCAGTALFPLIEPIALTYCVLAVSVRSAPGLRDAARYGDFSYGLYLYAYPLQQLVQQSFGAALGFAPAFALSLAATAVCAAISWHCVEKRFLRFKPRAPVSGASAPPAGALLASAPPSRRAGPAKSAVAH